MNFKGGNIMGIRKFLCVALVVFSLAIILPKESGAVGLKNWSHPQPQGNSYNSVASGGAGSTIIAGENSLDKYTGNVLMSSFSVPDLPCEFTSVKDGLPDHPETSVAICGERIFTSKDYGATWTEQLNPLSSKLYFITYWPGTIEPKGFRIRGANGETIESSNGIIWQVVRTAHSPSKSVSHVTSNAVAVSLNGEAFGNNTEVIVGASGTIITSSDGGATWTSRTSGTTQNLYAVAFANNTFVAVGYWDTVITSSDNGVTWTKRTTNTYSSLYGIAYGNGLFVAVGGDIFTSPNGITWTKRTSPTTNKLNGISFNAASNTFTAVGAGGAWVTSTDGITWTSMLQGTSNTMLGVTYANNIFAAVGAAGTILTSPDGAAWTERTSGTTDTLTGIAYGNNGFVAVGGGSSGLVLTSSDGIIWTNRGSKATATLADVAYGNGLFAAGGMSGALVTSPDSVNWTTRSSGVTGKITGVAYGNGGFVAVAETEGDYTAPSGVILTSTDGITWSKKTFADYHFYGVTYGNGLFVAVGGDNNSQGALLTSPDGVTWTPRTPGTNNLLVGAIYGGGVFMVVGQNGITVTSPDGITWTARNSITKNYLYRAAYGNTAFVAVGYLGTIVRSEGCYSILSTYNLSLHAPYITFNGQSYWADFYYASGSDFTLYNAGLISDAGSYSSCAPSILSSDGKLSIPQVNYSGLPFWADFQYTSGLTFILTVGGTR